MRIGSFHPARVVAPRQYRYPILESNKVILQHRHGARTVFSTISFSRGCVRRPEVSMPGARRVTTPNRPFVVIAINLCLWGAKRTRQIAGHCSKSSVAYSIRCVNSTKTNPPIFPQDSPSWVSSSGFVRPWVTAIAGSVRIKNGGFLRI